MCCSHRTASCHTATVRLNRAQVARTVATDRRSATPIGLLLGAGCRGDGSYRAVDRNLPCIRHARRHRPLATDARHHRTDPGPDRTHFDRINAFHVGHRRDSRGWQPGVSRVGWRAVRLHWRLHRSPLPRRLTDAAGWPRLRWSLTFVGLVRCDRLPPVRAVGIFCCGYLVTVSEWRHSPWRSDEDKCFASQWNSGHVEQRASR